MLVPTMAIAGVKMKIGEETEIDLGFRLQTQFIATNDDAGGLGESAEEFQVRRGRIRLGGNVTEYVKFFMQTDTGSPAGTVTSVAVLDGTKKTYNSPPQLEKATQIKTQTQSFPLDQNTPQPAGGAGDRGDHFAFSRVSRCRPFRPDPCSVAITREPI